MKDWAAFVGLLFLGFVLRNFIRHAYTRIRKRVDDAIPDHLPIGGGEWLRDRAELEGVRVLIGPRNHDTGSYIPSSNTIVISPDVDEKRDASFWATAAHELGHALFYRSSIVIRFVFMLGRVVSMAGATVGTFLVFANVLYARADINALAFHCLEASLAGLLLVLVDEAVASLIAMRLLWRDERLDRRDIVGAITSLTAGYMTYVGFFVGQLIVVLQRDFVVGLVERHRHFTPASPMGGVRLGAVAVLGVLLTVWAIHGAIRGAKRDKAFDVEQVKSAEGSRTLHELGRGLLGIVVVWLVWDQPGAVVPIVSVVGLLGSRLPLEILASLADALVKCVALVVYAILVVVYFIALRPLFRRLFRRPVPTATATAKEEAAPASMRSQAVAERLEIERYNEPGLPMRLAPLAGPLFHLAFAFGLVVVIVSAR